MNPSATRPRSGRRTFLRHLGATAAAAVGLAALPRDARAASGAPPDVPPENCTVYCYMIGSPCSDDITSTEFRCVSKCGGSQRVCYRRSAVNFCLSQDPC